VRVVQYISNQVRRQFRFGFFKAASGHGRSTQTHAAGDKWLFWVVRNGVLVDRDVSLAQCFFSHFTGDALGTQVYQHDVAFSATGHDTQTALNQSAGQNVSVLNNLSSVGLELGSQSFLERNSLTSDHVDQWTALNAG